MSLWWRKVWSSEPRQVGRSVDLVSSPQTRSREYPSRTSDAGQDERINMTKPPMTDAQRFQSGQIRNKALFSLEILFDRALSKPDL